MNYPGKNLAPVSDPLAFLAGGGETGSLIRAMDWSKTSLGPVTGWPQSLRTTVSICLASDLPICVIWGPDLVQLYNDAYRVICGGKHPQSMGQNFPECWREAWPVIGEAHDSALAGDKAFLEVQQIFLERHGYVEECFFTFSFSPIRDEAGRVGGLFHPVIEMTTQMLSERRTRTLRDVAAQTSKAKSVNEALLMSAQTLARYGLDLPFTLLYALEPDGDQARLVGSTGLKEDTVASLGTVFFGTGKQTLWPLEEVVRSGSAVQIDDVRQRIGLASFGPYPEPPNTALALPITLPGADRPTAILIAGVSSRLPMNEAYRGFYELLASAVTGAVSSARAHDDECRRAKALVEVDRGSGLPSFQNQVTGPAWLLLRADYNLDMRQRDVTDRRTAEAAIRASEERVRSILESITDGFFTLDRNWRITYINAAGKRFLDRTPGDLIGKVLWDEFPGTPGSEFERVYRRVVAGQVAESFTAYYPNFERWYEATVYPAMEGLSVYFRDVTEQKLSEERLRASEAQQRLALDAAELGTWNVEPATGAVQTDARFRAIFGTTEESPDSAKLFAIIHPDDVAAVQDAMAAATRLEDPTPCDIEYRVVHPDRSLRWVSAKGRSSFDGAGPTRRVVSFDGTVADITDRKQNEDALKASENRSQTILDSVTDGFFALDRDWRFTYMNAAGERSIDCTPGYLIGKCFWDEYPGTVGSEFDRLYRRVAASRVSESLEAHSPDNNRRYEVTAYPAPDGLSVYFRDVTERRQIEQERQQFAALVDASSDFIGVAGLDQRGIYLNRAGEELIGLSPGKVTTISMLDCFPESEHGRVLGLIANSNGGDHVVVDTWFQHLQTGQLIPVSWSFLRLRDTSGNVSGYATVTRDLTERNRAETQLRGSEERRRLALDAAELGTWHVEPATRATKTDARYRAIFGTTEEWTDYLQAVAVIHPEDQPAVLEAVSAATRLENPVPYAIEFRIVHPDGSLRWVLANGRSIFQGAGPTRRVTSFDGTVADITDRKRGETEREQLVARLREQDQRKDEFLATLAHELRNPLAAIRNGLYILGLARGDQEKTEMVRLMMERQVGQMVHLIDDLLDLSRISRGKIDLRKERIELARAIERAIEASWPSIENAAHELVVEVPPETIYVDADLTRLTQVFSNLLNNAAKFTERGGRVRLAVQLIGAEAVVSVADNGIGIPPRMLSRVFEMFTQVDGNLGRSQGGLGIGLSIVQQVVQMHGGWVEARSDGLGKGSEFVVRLPVALSLALDQHAAEVNPIPPAARLRILVADDNRDSAASLAMLLTLEGNETRTAHDGLDALDMAATFRPDAILLDIGMPKLDGYEVCRRIRQQSWGKNMVVIALTGWGQEDDRRKSHVAGFDFHLVKPVDLGVLSKLLAGVTAKVSWNSVREDKLIDDFGRDFTLQNQAPMQLNQTQEGLRQLQKVDAAGQLIDGIAHDLNNLLQIISADLQLILKQGVASSDLEKRVNNAQEAVKRGAKLANQLLAFSISQALERK